MIHPKHGAVVVHNTVDLDRHKGLGFAVEVPPVAEEVIEVLEPDDDLPKRRGRPPKGK